MTQDQVDWAALLLSLAMIGLYEAWTLRRQHTHPELTASSAHARMRAVWAEELAGKPGFEIVAVQTLRNSLMSATIAASTAALALMGSISLAGSTLARGTMGLDPMQLSPRQAMELLLMLTLFASCVSSAMAMRYFNHAGFIMAMPVESDARRRFNPMAVAYVQRGGLHYGWGLRFFFMVAPLVAGIVNASLMPVMVLALLVVLRHFDRPALSGEVPS